jgi:hypothetical protein
MQYLTNPIYERGNIMFTGRYITLLCSIALVILIAAYADEAIAQNIVSNPGFEAGEVGGLPENWRDQKERGAQGRVVITDTGAHSGRKCLLIEHANDDGYIHPNKSVKAEPGDYTFRFWATSDRNIKFVAQIYYETDWSMMVDESCNLEAGEWTKFEFPVSSLVAFSGSIQIGLTARGNLWLDDVELVRSAGARETADIRIWDTLSPLSRSLDQAIIQGKTGWSAIPTGEAYSPKGDLVLENEYLYVAFLSKEGKVAIRSKSGEKRAEITPLQLKGKPANVTSCKVSSYTGDKAIVEANFSSEGTELSVVFSFSKRQIIHVDPAESAKGISLFSPIEYAIVPNFISDDLIFTSEVYSSADATLYIPSENLFLGLLEGEESMLFMTWPEGQQEIRLPLAKSRLFESVDFENDGKTLYLAILDAPGIWHKEELKPSYLEKAVAVDWKRPFPAKWITQLSEDGVNTTYTFKESEPGTQGFWRAGVGWYTYPVWFNEGKAFYHLGKKVPPRGESLTYFLERKGTPVSVSTPVDIMKQTLDSQLYESIIDPEGRRNRSLTRPNCAIGTATCEVTDGLKPIFEAGEEVEKKDYVKGGTEDMVYFLTRERERALEYQDFAHEMMEFLASTRKDKPELGWFMDRMGNITKEITEAYEHEKENIKDLEYARELAAKTRALTERNDPGNFAAFMKLKGEWTGMGGAIDDLNRKLHTITRKLFQEAGYSCIKQPEAVKIAEEIRKRTVKCLRRPGGYEIWSNY